MCRDKSERKSIRLVDIKLIRSDMLVAMSIYDEIILSG